MLLPADFFIDMYRGALFASQQYWQEKALAAALAGTWSSAFPCFSKASGSLYEHGVHSVSFTDEGDSENGQHLNSHQERIDMTTKHTATMACSWVTSATLYIIQPR
jgi:hypothetical protein